ncbi:MAG: ABC transporter substrate-binding protein [Deltaproteobacteria bacterium]|nr:ABC transporter substrate-binding protein [Deltaproteobacteria bacterium]
MLKKKWQKFFISVISITFLFGLPSAFAEDKINIGSLNDMTGATSDVGKDYALGISEAIHYVNDMGGINGKKIKLYQFDYGYRIPEALTKYKLFTRLGCKAILGWGTGDTEALSPTITRDKIPYISASYSGHLTNPDKTPYNIFSGTDYSSNARATLTAWFDTKWKNHPDFGKRKPKLICSYMTSHPYCSAPIKAIKDQAKILGFEVGNDQDVSLFAIDTKSQILAMKKFKPDVVWHGNTTMSVAATLKDAYAMKLGATHLINVWGYDKNLIKLAGKAADGAMGATVCAFVGEDVPLMDKVVEYAKKYNPSIPIEDRLIRTVQAWGNVMVLWEAMKRADKAGDLSGESIRQNGFETMANFDVGLGIAPVTYSASDHRPGKIVTVYEINDGKFNLIDKVNLGQRWADKWNSWLGW